MRKFRHKSEGFEPDKELKLRAAGYVRVSTEEQAQHGYSIGAQQERIEQACKAGGYTLVRQYVDEGCSGKNLERPMAQKLIADARAKKFDLILVYKLDRLSRRLGDLIPLGEKLEKWGVAIKSVTEPFETTTPSGKLLFNMLGSFAQFEREMIGDRTRLGQRKRLREGKWNWRKPYGYSVDKEGFLHPEPGEMEFIRRIFRLCLYHNLGIMSIARLLQKEDVSTRRRGKWVRNGVWHILTNPVYAGLLNHGGELIKGVHEPAVSKEDFNRVQETLKSRLHEAPRNLQSPNVLVGLVRCGKCGGTMTTQKGKRKYHYYACHLRVEKCGMPYIPSKLLERSVLGRIREIAANPGMLEACLAKRREANKKGIQSLTNEKRAVHKRLEALEGLRKRRVCWLVDNLPEKSVADQVSGEIKNQLDEIEALKAKLADLNAKSADIDRDEADAKEVARYLKTFVETYDDLELGQRRLLMRALVKEVVVLDKRRCKAEFYIPLPIGKQASKDRSKKKKPEKQSLFQPKEKPEPQYAGVPVTLFNQNGSPCGTKRVTFVGLKKSLDIHRFSASLG